MSYYIKSKDYRALYKALMGGARVVAELSPEAFDGKKMPGVAILQGEASLIACAIYISMPGDFTEGAFVKWCSMNNLEWFQQINEQP